MSETPKTTGSSSLRLLEETLVKALLPREAEKQHAKGSIAKKHLIPFAQRIKELSSYYVEGLANNASRQFSFQDAAAYALYYLPVNFWKLRLLLNDLPTSYTKKHYEVLDFGCGPGTGILAAQSLLHEKCCYTGIDYSRAMIECARRIQAHSPWPSAQVNYLQGAEIPERKFNIIFCANVISELGSGKSFELIETLYESMAHQAALLLLEPGSQNITRNFMLLRDIVLSRFHDLVPYFPCTHTDVCPMLASSQKDWCHGTVHWEAPLIVRQIDALCDLNKHRTKFSAFVFIRNGELRQGCRALNDARKSKSGVSFLVCGKGHYGEMFVSKKDSPEIRQSARRVRQYDLLSVKRSPNEELKFSPTALLKREPFAKHSTQRENS